MVFVSRLAVRVYLKLCSQLQAPLGSSSLESRSFAVALYYFSHSFLLSRFFPFRMHFSQFLLAAAAIAPAFGQLSGKVGPLTTHAAKTAKKTCNVMNYGAKADKSTDLGPALLKAFTACKTGGTVIVPSGDYALKTWVTFEGGKAWALQLDGIIYRTGTEAGNMLFVRNANDFEMFSSTGKGAIQGISLHM